MEKVVVVQAEATNADANTVGIVEIRLLKDKKRAVLSDRCRNRCCVMSCCCWRWL